MELKTRKGESFFIDDEDYDLVKDTIWFKNHYGYITGWCKRRKTKKLLHRVIMNISDSSTPFIDHINRIRTDNRKSNLRTCTALENATNRKSSKSATSKYLGVYLVKQKSKRQGSDIIYTRIKCCIRVNGKTIHIGTFKNEIEAAKKYNEAAIKYHGKFANLNTFK